MRLWRLGKKEKKLRMVTTWEGRAEKMQLGSWIIQVTYSGKYEGSRVVAIVDSRTVQVRPWRFYEKWFFHVAKNLQPLQDRIK